MPQTFASANETSSNTLGVVTRENEKEPGLKPLRISRKHLKRNEESDFKITDGSRGFALQPVAKVDMNVYECHESSGRDL